MVETSPGWIITALHPYARRVGEDGTPARGEVLDRQYCMGTPERGAATIPLGSFKATRARKARAAREVQCNVMVRKYDLRNVSRPHIMDGRELARKDGAMRHNFKSLGPGRVDHAVGDSTQTSGWCGAVRCGAVQCGAMRCGRLVGW